MSRAASNRWWLEVTQISRNLIFILEKRTTLVIYFYFIVHYNQIMKKKLNAHFPVKLISFELPSPKRGNLSKTKTRASVCYSANMKRRVYQIEANHKTEEDIEHSHQESNRIQISHFKMVKNDLKIQQGLTHSGFYPHCSSLGKSRLSTQNISDQNIEIGISHKKRVENKCKDALMNKNRNKIEQKYSINHTKRLTYKIRTEAEKRAQTQGAQIKNSLFIIQPAKTQQTKRIMQKQPNQQNPYTKQRRFSSGKIHNSNQKLSTTNRTIKSPEKKNIKNGDSLRMNMINLSEHLKPSLKSRDAKIQNNIMPKKLSMSPSKFYELAIRNGQNGKGENNRRKFSDHLPSKLLSKEKLKVEVLERKVKQSKEEVRGIKVQERCKDKEGSKYVSDQVETNIRKKSSLDTNFYCGSVKAPQRSILDDLKTRKEKVLGNRIIRVEIYKRVSATYSSSLHPSYLHSKKLKEDEFEIEAWDSPEFKESDLVQYI